MIYRKKLIILGSLAGALLFANMAVTVLNSTAFNSRSSSFSLIDERSLGRIDGVDITGGEDAVSLIRQNNQWFVAADNKQYPAKQERVDDFLSLFTKKALYPVKSKSPAALASLGLSDENAKRIKIKAGAGLPLIDLLLGGNDLTGREIYIRKNNEDTVHSAADGFTSFITGAKTSWLNLRLFPALNGPIPADVQRITVVYPLPALQTAVFTRSANTWTVTGLNINNIDRTKVDSWLSGIFNTEAENFSEGETVFDDGRVTIELGNGGSISLAFSAEDEAKKRSVSLSGSTYIYSLAGWSVDRIFRDTSYFAQQ